MGASASSVPSVVTCHSPRQVSTVILLVTRQIVEVVIHLVLLLLAVHLMLIEIALHQVLLCVVDHVPVDDHDVHVDVVVTPERTIWVDGNGT